MTFKQYFKRKLIKILNTDSIHIQFGYNEYDENTIIIQVIGLRDTVVINYNDYYTYVRFENEFMPMSYDEGLLYFLKRLVNICDMVIHNQSNGTPDVEIDIPNMRYS